MIFGERRLTGGLSTASASRNITPNRPISRTLESRKGSTNRTFERPSSRLCDVKVYPEHKNIENIYTEGT